MPRRSRIRANLAAWLREAAALLAILAFIAALGLIGLAAEHAILSARGYR